jgi:hypothetical protein
MKNLMLLLNEGKAISTFLKDKLPISTSVFLSIFLLSFFPANAMRERTDHECSNLVLSSITVGTGGNYTTLKAAFDAINSGVVTGVVTIAIISSTTETAMASLNASGTGLANYSSVLLYATGSGYSVSGNIDNPLVSLNGADNVTIDGRVNATGTTTDLIFVNTSTGVAASALRLINSAENNTVRYASLKASGLSAATGIVYFVSSASGNGNDNNIIEYCNLTSAGVNRPMNAILSYGTAGRENSGNIIRFNALYNFFNDSNSSNGINISGNSMDWKITSNSFYDTASLICTGNNIYSVIRISTTSMNTVSGNFIGGSGPLCAGAPWTMNSSFATFFSGIFFTGNTGASSLLENNTIQNFVYSSTSTNPWDGIYLSAGNATLLGNTIGSGTGTNSILVITPNASATATISGGVVTALTLVGGGSGFTVAPLITFTSSGSTATATATAVISGGIVTGFTITNGGSGYTSAPNVNVNGSGYSTTHGIRYLNSGEVSMENNTIGSITTNGNAGYSHCFEGIVINGIASSTITINNNLIGSLSTANSIRTSSPATASIFKQDLRGIYVNSAVNLVTITGNTIANLTSAYNGTSVTKVDGICTGGASNIIRNNTIRDLTSSANSTLRGIQQTVVLAGTNQSVAGNTVYNLRNTHGSAAVGVIGIDYTGPNSGTNSVTGNFIHDLFVSSTNILSEIDGILLGNGVTTTDNNIINIGTGVTGGYKIYGINDNSSNNAIYNNNIYFNTVYVAGAVSSGTTSSTAALWNLNNTVIRNYRNNILMNVRTGGATGKHYAIRIAGLSGLTIDYNDYVVTGNAFLGSFSTDKTTLALWKAATSQDASSLNINPLFAVAGSNIALNYYTSASLPAVTGTGITADYTGFARSAIPKMGALEITGYVWSGATNTDFSIATNWQGGLVPPNGSDISFAVSPFNDCVLDQNRTLRNITNAQPTYKFRLNGHELTLTGNLVFSNNAKIDATAVGSIFTFAGTVVQNIPAGALFSNTMDGLNVNNSEGLTLNDNISVNNLLTLTSGTLKVGETTLGISGTINKISGNIEVSPLSSLNFGGSGVLTLASDLFNANPSLNNLTINRSGGVVLGQETTVGGVLNLLSGTLNIATLNLTINTLSVTAPSATKMIIADGGGEIRKILTEHIPFTYPVGDASVTAEYSPITITLNDDNSASHYFGIKVANAKHPNNASTSNYLNRYWMVSQSGGSSHVATLNAIYMNPDITGTESAISGATLNGVFNQMNNPWIKYNALSANTIIVDNATLMSGQVTAVTGISGANPTVSITGTGDTCIGSNVPLNTVVNGDASFIYSWTPAIFLSSASIANPVVTNITASTSYTVTVKDGNGISASAIGTVNIGPTTNWNGAWSNGVPTSTTSVIISSNYTPISSFECCSLTVNNNAVVLIPSGINVTLNGILTVVSGSSFTMQNNSNLIQNSNQANSGNITVIRDSAPIIRLDHTLWSSPVTGTQTLQQFSPNTLSNRFYVYNILNNTYTVTPAIGNFPLAKAIAVRAPNNWPTTQTAWPGSFTGIPNNGTITTPLEMTGAAYNGLGNPYPSTINGTTLVNANSTMITGTLYLYAHTLAINATTGLFPPGTNYALWNPGMGGTPATVGDGGTGNSPVTPNGIIQTGQGFLVKAVAQGNMVFTNSMRTINNANQFFKGSVLKANTAEPDIERHRIWLNLGSASAALNTILVGYAAGATTGVDYGYDGLKFGGTGSELYSVIAGDSYSIQGRGLPFIADDTVSLGFKAAESGTFTIAIYKTDGLFTGDQDILIKDNLTRTTSSIKTTPYTFSSDIGTFDTRFEMVYTKGTLGIDPQTTLENSVILYLKNDILFVQSSGIITAVRIFDMLGRLIFENKNINDTHFQYDKSRLTGQVVLVEVSDNENHKVVKKIIF